MKTFSLMLADWCAVLTYNSYFPPWGVSERENWWNRIKNDSLRLNFFLLCHQPLSHLPPYFKHMRAWRESCAALLARSVRNETRKVSWAREKYQKSDIEGELEGARMTTTNVDFPKVMIWGETWETRWWWQWKSILLMIMRISCHFRYRD